jgi:tetratricopeptide (TPR) repeat protein
MWTLPCAVFVLAESMCLLGGYGGYPSVIQRVGEDDGVTWYDTSRRGTDTFFGRAVQGGGMREIHFTSPKPANTTRIAFLGESAIQGFPQPLPLTNGSFLEAMLREVWGGERAVEVLNFGATAVASFPVLCILDEVLDHDPDLVVVMVGNNEFYGAYGMASLPRLARSPAGMRLLRWVRGLGLSQWLQSLMQDKAPKSGTLMERAAAAKAQIRDDDRMREAAAKSLRSHLASMVRRCAARKVPVILCTVPTNERDLAPIGSDAAPRLPDTERPAFEQNLSLAAKLLTDDPEGAAEKARAMIELDSSHARAHFILGQALSQMGKHTEALAAYVRARDLDTMPWRATSAAQAAVRDAASEGAILCDMEAAFRAESPGGAIGWELLDDHVHMSLRGQALFARALATTMAAMPEPLHVNAEAIEKQSPWDTVADRLGHSVYTDYLATSHLRKLFEIDFFRKNNEVAYRRIDRLDKGLLARMSDVDRKAVERWRDPSLHGETERPLEWVIGVYRMEGGDYEAAAQLFRVARESVARVSLWRLELTWLLLACNRHLESTATSANEQLCREAIQIGRLLERHGGAENPRVLRYLGLAYNLAGEHSAAIARLEPVLRAGSGEAAWEVVAALVDSYLQVGRKDAARRLLELAMRDPQMAAAAQRMQHQIDN